MMHRYYPRAEDRQRLQSGPLGPHLDPFAALLTEQGYTVEAGRQKIRLVAGLSRWLAAHRLGLHQLDERQVAAFLAARRKRLKGCLSGPHTLALLLQQLRQTDIIPRRRLSKPPQPSEVLERDFGRFLEDERGLLASSVSKYLPVARRFLSHQFPAGSLRLDRLRAHHVTGFLLRDMALRSGRSAQLAATALRSFLGFLHQHGRSATNLTGAIPPVAGGRASELPRFLPADQVEQLLQRCDRRGEQGLRNYAILLLLARLGLRAHEVAELTLEDIDWAAGELRIRGKHARLDRLPLPCEVGQAVAAYLKKGRPTCACRRVFIRTTAPRRGFANPSLIGYIVWRALVRARLQPLRKGAHILRHSLATRMLRGGASLAQIGQVLRHQQVQTTEIYAKVDERALRTLAQPWPGGGR